MIQIKGNIFLQEYDAICITTNGIIQNRKLIMGAGIAKAAAQRWPTLPLRFGAFILDKRKTDPEWNHVFPQANDGVYVVAFPVKYRFWEKADLALTERSCQELVRLTDEFDWKRVVLPKPGCGAGKLDWKTEVEPICKKYFDNRFIVVDLK